MSPETPRFQFVTDEFLSKGDLIAGRYRVEFPLGSGGFAQVVLASHLEVESLKVAVKVVHPHRVTPETLQRFRNEARLLARLRNRHTVKLTDFGITEENVAYLVMEYVEGTPLDRVIYAKRALSEADTARVGIGILKALVEAHSHGVIHRDLKPANIMMVAEVGERHAVPRVLDFGIAKVLGGASPVDDHILHADGTYEPVVYCTPAYAAPELLRGRPEFATDLYALGLVLCEMLDGRPPYDYPDDEPANSPHLWAEPVPLGRRAAASRLAGVLRRALEKDLGARYISAEEMLDDLEKVYDRIRRAEEESSSLDVLALGPDPTAPPTPAVSRAARFVQTSMVAGVPAMRSEGPTGRPEPPVRREVGRRPDKSGSSKPVLWSPDEATRKMQSERQRATDTKASRSVRHDLVGHNRPKSRGSRPIVAGDHRGASGPSVPRLAESGASEPSGTPRHTTTPTDMPAESTHGGARRVPPPVPAPMEAPILPKPSRNDSRLAEIPLFGRRVASTKARGLGIVIVVLAIALPAIIAAWSVYVYVRGDQSAPSGFVEVEDEN